MLLLTCTDFRTSWHRVQKLAQKPLRESYIVENTVLFGTRGSLVTPNNHQLLSSSIMKRKQSNSPKVNSKRPRAIESPESHQTADNSEWTKVEKRKAKVKNQKQKAMCVCSHTYHSHLYVSEWHVVIPSLFPVLRFHSRPNRDSCITIAKSTNGRML